MRHTLTRQHLCYGKVGEEREWELSWLQSSKVVDLSPDGKGILFAESREGVGPWGAYFRKAFGADPHSALGMVTRWCFLQTANGRVVCSYDTVVELRPAAHGAGRTSPSSQKRVSRRDWAVFLDAQKLPLGAAGADKGISDTMRRTSPWCSSNPGARSPERGSPLFSGAGPHP
ncbi:MAG: hypothetical protein IPN59_08410, partial [Holophaga sp.]|nr:hypothetical protein [Holophaga sp.]